MDKDSKCKERLKTDSLSKPFAEECDHRNRPPYEFLNSEDLVPNIGITSLDAFSPVKPRDHIPFKNGKKISKHEAEFLKKSSSACDINTDCKISDKESNGNVSFDSTDEEECHMGRRENDSRVVKWNLYCELCHQSFFMVKDYEKHINLSHRAVEKVDPNDDKKGISGEKNYGLKEITDFSLNGIDILKMKEENCAAETLTCEKFEDQDSRVGEVKTDVFNSFLGNFKFSVVEKITIVNDKNTGTRNVCINYERRVIEEDGEVINLSNKLQATFKSNMNATTKDKHDQSQLSSKDKRCSYFKEKLVDNAPVKDKRVQTKSNRKEKRNNYLKEKLTRKRFKCPVCHKDFISNDVLRSHKKTHNLHPCPYCPKYFASVKILQTHQSTKHGKYVRKCVNCDALFHNVAVYEFHKRDCHTRYLCDACGSVFLSSRAFKHHRETHFQKGAISISNDIISDKNSPFIKH
ncbi:hypothetical protein TNCT_147181 [Trichonephila clavata]|uniref:C2H2-type domain-containing protein n=1 Tax=Trichonephila clavata TaxID=2740835 RepID=A0A8X6GV79_TRICU|nr:hypothetical protein TNCT_147181 [Trichonephila clavata]